MLTVIYSLLGTAYAWWRLGAWLRVHRDHYAEPQVSSDIELWFLFPSESWNRTLGLSDLHAGSPLHLAAHSWEARGINRQVRLHHLRHYLALTRWVWPFLVARNIALCAYYVPWLVALLIMSVWPPVKARRPKGERPHY
ncbi:MAG: hypothetical protein WAZ14_01435 [Patescibacteria group bacterium]